MSENATPSQTPKTDEFDRAEVASYFKDESSLLVFALLHLDLEIRKKVLGISADLYESKADAKKWYRRLRIQIHPDHCKLPGATKAFAELKRMYELMVEEEASEEGQEDGE
ncbi:hypothetical protein C798_25380 [Herbaspirillum rubrisubalbicans Os34]|uniref:J domain-containing protein n=1 Tax=Herbaspirillum rubrisubalbicans Os34 TaxID=1235827 RepID=A0A6M3ZY14_9BURK|nr:DnaJ domain-containing protein [Herbaspirillum rubrisubalbicans]QJQ03447.1 hypothetical protein C798_25380 [Herbaspirillum rubrisubalbicans Os34]